MSSGFKQAAQKLVAGAKVAPNQPTPRRASDTIVALSLTRRSSEAGAPSGAAGAAVPWEAVCGTLQRNFVQRVTNFDARYVSAATCAAVRATLPAGSDAQELVGKASAACAPLWSWAHTALELADSLQASRGARAGAGAPASAR